MPKNSAINKAIHARITDQEKQDDAAMRALNSMAALPSLGASQPAAIPNMAPPVVQPPPVPSVPSAPRFPSIMAAIQKRKAPLVPKMPKLPKL